MKEDKTITIPSNSDEMSVQQLIYLVTGNVQALLGLSDEELDHVDLDDLERAMEIWNKIELHPATYSEPLVVGGRKFVLNTLLHDWTVGEKIELEDAMKNPEKNLHLLIALHTRPAETKMEMLNRLGRNKEPMRKMVRAARTKQKWFPAPYTKAELHERAEFFLQNMTGSQALMISTMFAALGIEMVKQWAETA
jgi:hypothetical protein